MIQVKVQAIHSTKFRLQIASAEEQNSCTASEWRCPSKTCKYRFGPFELRTQTRELYKHGVKLKLRPQAYQVLAVLLERAGDAVTREELLKRVWPSDTFVDFEHGLNTAIKELRGALSDSATEPRYIETLPKLGYRVIAPVEDGGRGYRGER